MRNLITLACTECKQRNYQTNKNKKNDPDRIELMKYCKFCKKETLHKETKQQEGTLDMAEQAVVKKKGFARIAEYFITYCRMRLIMEVMVKQWA